MPQIQVPIYPSRLQQNFVTSPSARGRQSLQAGPFNFPVANGSNKGNSVTDSQVVF
jgi:hypothetical protein